ncbi:MAG: MBL fold metallo-hydrolase [Vicinamibacterales bacterium]
MGVNRREFVKVSTLTGVAGALSTVPAGALSTVPAGALSSASAVAATRQAAPPPAAAVFMPLRRNVGIFNQRGGTIGWLVSPDGLLVVDTQFADTAPNLLTGLKERSPRQIDVVINSHHHPDHTGGNGVLRPAAKQIVAHVRSSENQRLQAERAKAPTTLPDVTFPETWSVTLGDETVRAKHWGPAHTGGDVAIHFEQANVVHLGDLLNNRGYPNVDAPPGRRCTAGCRCSRRWRRPIRPMRCTCSGMPKPATRSSARAAISTTSATTSAVVETARRARRDGRSRDDLVKIEALPKFEHFGGTRARLGLALGIAYDELAARA